MYQILKNTALPLKFNDTKSLKKLSKKNDLAAIIIEPSRLERLDHTFISTLNKICKKKIILIADEITSGWRDCTGGI